jgi:hypothetical protein
MPRFRPRLTSPISPLAASPDLLTVGQLIDELMQPGHFFVAPNQSLQWNGPQTEDVPWETFRGRLVDLSQTRRQARLLSWHLTAEDGSPMLSVRLDVHAGVVHVTRGILCYVWEAYDAGGSVIESREVQRWTTELVGSAELDRFPDIEELRDELVCLIWQAIVGTSKLPLYSVEAPLPAFTFGHLYYCYQQCVTDVAEPMRDWQALLDAIDRPELAQRERARVLEAVLRHVDFGDLDQVVERMRAAPKDTVQLLRTVFNEVSLSPVTHFLGNARWLAAKLLVTHRLSAVEHFDLVGGLMRQLARHLTAYDLVTFHHRGANYPDVLLLDALLRDSLLALAPRAGLFLGDEPSQRLRRRALRQASLLRRHYEGHLVPDEPTSPGENTRVLPPPHVRVPEEQLLQPHRRRRRLFSGQSLAGWQVMDHVQEVLTQSLLDLSEPAERAELGIGLFIDRPLGYGKATGEPDYTPLLAHEAFSVTIARRRVKELATLARELALDVPGDLYDSVDHALQTMPLRGVPAAQLAEPTRPTAALADVRRVTEDFLIVRTMPGRLRELLGYFDFGALQERYDLPMLRPGKLPRVVAMVQTPRGPVLGFFDGDYHLRLEAVVDDQPGFVRRAGEELPVAGLRIVAVDGEPQPPLQVTRRAGSVSDG